MRYKVTVQYDGSKFHGWQIQPKHRTVQEDIEKALSIIHKTPITITGSGRTDKFVHALAQVFHFDSALDISEQKWKDALNRLLSKDIYILEVKRVAEDFHARFSALSKTYIYRLNTGEHNVFEKDYVYQLDKKIELAKLNEAMELFVGKHDFIAFNATEVAINPYQIRHIYSFKVEEMNNEVVFEIKGKGFLRYMVRMIIGVCVNYALGKIELDTIKNAINEGTKTSIKANISPVGLYLKEVQYPKDLYTLSLQELWYLFPIELIPYTPEWKTRFEEEKIRLTEIVPVDSIYHIGSTALTNLKSKDIVDIMIQTEDKTEWSNLKNKLIEIGYRFIYENDERMHFNKGYMEWGYDKPIHLHILTKGMDDELKFIRYLEKHPEALLQYQILKESLEIEYRYNRDGYTEAKTEFIRDILEKVK